MDIQPMTKEALEKAYQSQIIKLFNVYLDSVITSGDSAEEAEAAKSRFEAGLQLTQKVFVTTMEIAAIE